MSGVLKRILPWIVTSLVLGFIAYTTDLKAAWQTLQATNWLGFVPTVIAVCATVFLVDSWCLVKLFSRFNAPVTFREMLPLKGTSYFLNVINYNAAAAGIALFFRSKKGVPFIEALSSMLWLNFIDIVSLVLLVLMGLVISPRALSPAYMPGVLGLSAFVLLVLVGSCIYWNGKFDWFFFGKLRTWRIFKTFSTARLSDYAFFIGVRLAFVTTYVVSQAASMPFFNMNASLRELFLFVPVLTFVGTIPFTTIAGLGTVQLLMLEFFQPYTPAYSAHPIVDSDVRAQIIAYSTTTILSFVLVRIVIGMVFMGKVASGKNDTLTPDEVDPHPGPPLSGI